MTGVWLGASRALGRQVTVAEPYPHTCGSYVTGPTGREVKLWRRDCAACGWEAEQERRRQVAPEVAQEARAVEARMMGERDE